MEKKRQATPRENAAEKLPPGDFEIVSHALPPIDFELFSELAQCAFPQKFFVENRKRGIAELGFGICKTFPAGAKTRCRRADELTAEPDFFCALPFAGDAEKIVAHVAKWQFSLAENARGNVLVSRNVSAEEPARTAREIEAEYEIFLQKIREQNARDSAFPKLENAREAGGKKRYLDACADALDAISRNEFQKIVLARAIDFSAETEIPAEPLFAKIRKRFAARECTIFLFRESAEKTFLGATPEMIVGVKNGVVESEAIAGSLPNRGGNSFENDAEIGNFSSDEKELREHRAVVDFIAEKFRSANLGELNVPEKPEILRLPNVAHLRTPISARTSAETSAFSLVKILHPTPAMCGVPAEKAFRKILETEPFSRENFAGPVGFFRANGEGFFAVGIRCAKISGKNLRLYAGAGLVSGSIPEREFSEIDAKLAAIRDLLPR